MVELECNTTATSKTAGLENDDAEAKLFCRLCHGSIESDATDIFAPVAPASAEDGNSNVDDDTMVVDNDDDENETRQRPTYAACLTDLFKIEYEQHELLPSHICDKCLEMVRVFREFRQCLRKAEQELQQKLYKIKMTHAKYRPGLNGNPGVFEPDEDCEIIEINPDKDIISSDDEFSMDSETDDDTVTKNNEDANDEKDDADREQPSQLAMQTAPGDDVATARMNAAQILEPILASAIGATIGPLLQATQQAIAGNVPDALALGAGLDTHPKNTFLCQFCDLAFTTQTDCHDHELQQHDPTLPYRCSFCNLRLATRQALISHIKEAHDPERPYVCAHCNKGFCRRSDLKKHTIVHTGVRPFTCVVCSKSFSRNTNLTKHMRIHTSVKPFVCQVCPRSFQTAIELMRHTRTHTEVKPYQCNRCPTSFTRKDKLLMHEQVHVRRDAHNNALPLAPNNAMTEHPPPGEDAMASTLYPNSILAAQLQQQLPAARTAPTPTPPPPPTLPQPPVKSTHNRNYSCEICEKTFQRERDLQRHKALHLDTLFTCKLCGLGFSRSEKLARHELEQHAPHYPCDICRITFTRQTELEHHLKMHELQHNAALNTQAALNAVNASAAQAAAVAAAASLATSTSLDTMAEPAPPMSAAPAPPPPLHRASAADMSFYSQMVPTMNLGFYSETHPEERNGM